MLKGLLLGGSMIIPIGAQNAFIINQGIKRNHHLIAATVCAVCDILLILLGVFGSGSTIEQGSWLYQVIIWGGVIFLFTYGTLSLKRGLISSTKNDFRHNAKEKTVKLVVISALGVTLLNPHVYLDTVMILGGVSLQYIGSDKVTFALGCIIASIIWFYLLSVLAAKLAPLLSSIKVQKTIDIVVGLMMWFIAATLVF